MFYIYTVRGILHNPYPVKLLANDHKIIPGTQFCQKRVPEMPDQAISLWCDRTGAVIAVIGSPTVAAGVPVVSGVAVAAGVPQPRDCIL